MKVALIHDYLNQYGGAERVLETLMELFPDAPIYTLFHDPSRTLDRFSERVKKTSFLNKESVWRNHRLYIPLMPIAAQTMRLEDEYDLIVSSTSGFGKGFSYAPRAAHIAYCHTPLRYAWEHYQYFDHWSSITKFAASPMFAYLRWWDRRAGQKPNQLVANSHYIAEKISTYYHREAEVLYPPVDLKKFYYDRKVPKDGYFLAVGRLIHYKKFDLIINAFNKINLPLVIVGDGPELPYLKSIAKSAKIHFVPFISEDELRLLYNGAEAVLFPQVEDFGLVAAEALACGTPVIAFAGGGAKEIIQDGENGLLFHYQTPDGLSLAIKKFLLSSFDASTIKNSAKHLSKTHFKQRFTKLVKNLQIV